MSEQIYKTKSKRIHKASGAEASQSEANRPEVYARTAELIVETEVTLETIDQVLAEQLVDAK
jgi:hypothetical protein